MPSSYPLNCLPWADPVGLVAFVDTVDAVDSPTCTFAGL